MHRRSISVFVAVLIVAVLAGCIRFGAATTQSVPLGADEVIYDALVGDVTGDGVGDLLVHAGLYRYESPRTQVMVSCGTGCTTLGLSIPGWRPTKIADFDGDGIGDVLVNSAPFYQGAARLYFGGAATVSRPAGLAPDDWISLPDSWDYAAGDLDGDGDLDLVQTTTFMGYYLEHRLLRNDGTGSFADAGLIARTGPLNAGGGGIMLVNNGDRDVVHTRSSGAWSGLPPGAFGAVDVDGDAIDDIIAQVDDHVTFHRGTGPGYTPFPDYQTIEVPSITSWHVGDLDADGHTDLWINDAYAGTSTLLGGSGDGGFPYDPDGSVPPGRLRFGDLDGDRLPEAIGIATDQRSLVIYPNTSFT